MGSVSVTKNRIATKEDPPNEVDKQAASAAQIANLWIPILVSCDITALHLIRSAQIGDYIKM